MTSHHVESFLTAMGAGDAAAMSVHLADDATGKSPIVDATFEGKDRVVKLLGVILSAVDRIEVEDVVESESLVAAFTRVSLGDARLEGVVKLTLADDGRIESVTFIGRPLGALVLLQQRVAPVIGVAPLQLVPV